MEDKIIAFLTLKQFLILLGGGLFIFLFWSIFGLGIIFFVFTLPVIGLFALIAFGKFNGRPFVSNAPYLISFFTRPRVRIFRRINIVSSLPIVKKQEAPTAQLPEQPVASRLKRIAYLLDQKTAEEERLIHSGKMPQKWVNEI